MHMNNNLQAIILAAGKSTRFNTEKTKLAETICGQAMILFSTKLLAQLNIATTVVVGYQQEIIRTIIAQAHTESVEFVVQEKQEGTGHALACTQSHWKNDHILVLNGDVPLITADLIISLYKEHIAGNAAISFITSCTTEDDGRFYGRVIKKDNSIAIVEAKDFSTDMGNHCCINAGIYLIKKDFLKNYIATLDDNNASKEFYITDLVKIASTNGFPVITVKTPFDMVRGINTFQELSVVEEIKHVQLITYWMERGVRFLQPHAYLDLDIIIGPGSRIHGGVHLKKNTIIGKNCDIGEFSSLENVIVEDNVTIPSHCVIKNAFIKSNTQIEPLNYIHSQAVENSNTTSFTQKSTHNSHEFSFIGARLLHPDTSIDEQ